MNQKFKFLVIAAAFLTVFASCSKDDEKAPDVITSETKSVLVKMEDQTAQTYAVAFPVANNTPLIFNKGDLYFVTAAGLITKHMTISLLPTSSTNINVLALQFGLEIANIPGISEKVYIIGNNAGSLPTSGNISNVLSTMVDIDSQGHIINVNLYGEGDLEEGDDCEHCAKVRVMIKPLVSRIEIDNISACSDIKRFEVEGIFINHYYSKEQVDGTKSHVNFVDNGSNAARYIGGNSYYPTTLPLYDYSATGIGSMSGLTLWPDFLHFNDWAYDVFASDKIPQIVIRLKNVENVSGHKYPNPQFLTITGFRHNGHLLTSFEEGKVYRLDKGVLTFCEDDLVKPKSVDIEVSLLPWKVINVTPEIE